MPRRSVLDVAFLALIGLAFAALSIWAGAWGASGADGWADDPAPGVGLGLALALGLGLAATLTATFTATFIVMGSCVHPAGMNRWRLRLGRAWWLRQTRGIWAWGEMEAVDATAAQAAGHSEPHARTGHVQIVLDLGGWMLLKATPQTGPDDWMVVAPEDLKASSHAVRAALNRP